MRMRHHFARTAATGGLKRHLLSCSPPSVEREFLYRSLTTSPLDHRQRCERVLPKSINRQLNEPPMEARVRPRGSDSRDERAREAEPSYPARHVDPICAPK